VNLRTILEPIHLRIACNGARRDVYPSTMAREMGAGKKAYVLKMGRPTSREDLVETFGEAPLETIVSPEVQKAYFEEWKRSVKSKPQ